MNPADVEALFAGIGAGMTLIAGFYLTFVRGLIRLNLLAFVVGMFLVVGTLYLIAPL